ncbi:hypothetical protein [Streptosporangium vulgare]|uniref:hypothetical protein n=1 Tax=Streptosporangium vulgare TaxID=46190 RepID=UPI0031D47BB0
MFLLSGCDLGLDFRERQQEVVSYDVTAKLTALDVATGSGDIVVTESDRPAVHVTETIHWRGDKPTPKHPVDGGTAPPARRLPGQLLGRLQGRDPEGPQDQGRHRLGHHHDARAERGGERRERLGRDRGRRPHRQAVHRRDRLGRHRGEVLPPRPREVEIETGSGDVVAYVPQGGYDVIAETGSGDEGRGGDQGPLLARIGHAEDRSGDARVLLP